MLKTEQTKLAVVERANRQLGGVEGAIDVDSDFGDVSRAHCDAEIGMRRTTRSALSAANVVTGCPLATIVTVCGDEKASVRAARPDRTSRRAAGYAG
jgi:hypothetical protein